MKRRPSLKYAPDKEFWHHNAIFQFRVLQCVLKGVCLNVGGSLGCRFLRGLFNRKLIDNIRRNLHLKKTRYVTSLFISQFRFATRPKNCMELQKINSWAYLAWNTVSHSFSSKNEMKNSHIPWENTLLCLCFVYSFASPLKMAMRICLHFLFCFVMSADYFL